MLLKSWLFKRIKNDFFPDKQSQSVWKPSWLTLSILCRYHAIFRNKSKLSYIFESLELWGEGGGGEITFLTSKSTFGNWDHFCQAFWYPLESLGILWDSLEYFWATLLAKDIKNLLESHGILWSSLVGLRPLESFGIIWNSLESFKAAWSA